MGLASCIIVVMVYALSLYHLPQNYSRLFTVLGIALIIQALSLYHPPRKYTWLFKASGIAFMLYGLSLQQHGHKTSHGHHSVSWWIRFVTLPPATNVPVEKEINRVFMSVMLFTAPPRSQHYPRTRSIRLPSGGYWVHDVEEASSKYTHPGP